MSCCRVKGLPIQLLVAVLICSAGPARGDDRAGNQSDTRARSRAGKLLSSETVVIMTINLREILRDYRDVPSVQQYLDQWRLAAQGDRQQLVRHYDSHEVHRYEALSLKEYLDWAAMIRAGWNALGNDPLEDVGLITAGFAMANSHDFAVIVEGKFKRRSVESLEEFFRQYFFPVNQGPGAALALLDDQTLVFADSQATLDGIRARARDEQAGLPAGVQVLLESGQKKHLSIVINGLDKNIQHLARFIDEQLVGSIGVDPALSKSIVDQGTEWIKQNAADCAAVCFGISIREAELLLEFGLDTRKAGELRKALEAASFWGVQALKAFDHDFTRQLAGILTRQHVSRNETTLIVNFDVPREFIAQLLEDPSLDVFPDLRKTSAKIKPFPGQRELQGLAANATSMPLWKSGVDSSEIEEVRAVPYKSGPEADPIRHRLDMFLPRNKKDFPIVVLVHGGGWDMGDNRCSGLYSSVGEFLASQGIGTVLPNYRLSPAVKHPEHIKDVAKAVAWARSSAGKYGGDAGRLYLLGHSAGAHLVSLLVADDSFLKGEGMTSADIQGVLAFSGIYHIHAGPMYGNLGGAGPQALRLEQMLPLRGDSPVSWNWHPPGVHVTADIFGPAFGDSIERRTSASPIAHLRRGLPPFLIVSAEHDLPSVGPQSDEFYAALCKQGCEARLLRVPRRNHNSVLFSAIDRRDPAVQAIVEFVLK